MNMKLLFLEEVAERTRRPESTLRYWRHTGQGPKSTRVGRRVMYREEDVNSWLEEQYGDDNTDDDTDDDTKVPTFSAVRAGPVGRSRKAPAGDLA